MFKLVFGNSRYAMFDKSELIDKGYKMNPNINGEKFFFCVGCNRYTHHYHMSKDSHTVAICNQCERTAL